MRHEVAITGTCLDYSDQSSGKALDGSGRVERARIAVPQSHAILLAVKNVSSRPLAMIFDLDGVLIHSMPMHVEAWRQYLDALGLRYEDIEIRMHGKRNSELVRDLIGAALADDVVSEHGAAKERLFRDLLRDADIEQFRMPGLQAFLDRHADVPKAVGTNAEPANLNFVLDRFGLRRYFQVTVDGSQVSRPKPFPDIYLRAAELLKVSPQHCVVFEDSPTGAAAGIAAGMPVIGIETTPTTFNGVSLQVPDFSDPRLEDWLRAAF